MIKRRVMNDVIDAAYEDGGGGVYDAAELFDPEALDLSGFDPEQLDLSETVDPGAFAGAMPTISQRQIANLFQGVRFEMSEDQMQTLFSDLMYAVVDPRVRVN